MAWAWCSTRPTRQVRGARYSAPVDCLWLHGAGMGGLDALGVVLDQANSSGAAGLRYRVFQSLRQGPSRDWARCSTRPIPRVRAAGFLCRCP